MLEDTSVQTASKKMALLIATFASFLTPFMGSAINVALPSIGTEFKVDAIVLSWVATSYLLAAAVFLVPFGRIADIMGRKKIFTYGIIIFTVGSLLAGLSTSVSMLIVFRVIQAIGSSMIFGTGMAIITTVFPPGERGKAMGINVAAVYVGLSLGPFLGGFLTHYWSWRGIFYATVPFGLIVTYLITQKFKGEWAEAKGEKFDWLGSVIYGISLTAIIYGFSLLPKLTGGTLILSGIIGIVVFVWWELRSRYPVLDIHLFKGNKVFAFSNLAALINYSATFAITFLLSFYLQYIKSLTPEQAGMVLVAQPIVMAAFSPLMGRLSDRIEPGVVASIGMAISTVGLFLLIFLTNDTSLPVIVAILVLLGIGFAFFSSPNTNAVMSSVEKRFLGVASGTLGTMRLVGQMLSMGIAMLLFALFIGRDKITPENYPQFLMSMKTAFIVFCILCFAGVFFSLARGKVRQ